MFELEQKSMKEVTMSMYPGATCKDAHWTSFVNITDVAPSEDKDSSEESDSGGDSEQYTGLSLIVPTIQLSLHMYVGKHASSSEPEPAGLFNCLRPKF